MEETEFDLFLQMHRICYRKRVHFKEGGKDKKNKRNMKLREGGYVENNIHQRHIDTQPHHDGIQ